ncbi:hypothetical protein ACFTZM_31990, partial [Streptomyces hydrogenans]|uniref:hypothetical protein n=1 Tax=Streptomyces hydrogenans TaxID=1873719 RepID=UPI0036373217
MQRSPTVASECESALPPPPLPPPGQAGDRVLGYVSLMEKDASAFLGHLAHEMRPRSDQRAGLLV